MQIQTVGILSPGDMGQAVAAVLNQHGLKTIAALKAHRWIGEMEEIAETFKEVSLTERIFYGAADVYRLVKDTSLGKETPEECDRDRRLREIITVLSNETASNSV